MRNAQLQNVRRKKLKGMGWVFEARQLLWLFALKGSAHQGDVVTGGAVILKWILEE